MTSTSYDIAIIGGGINGCGIARDAAGRGLSVLLVEQDDLANGTSSASTKLIHGGLRYLEYYEFRLVRESLREREVLLRAAPHIIWPLRFILPHHKGLRPSWLIRLGLLLYDNIGGRKLLPPTTRIDLRTDARGKPLKEEFTVGFEYSDCWVIDSRLVVLNGRDAARLGADIRTRTRCTGARRNENGWQLALADTATGATSEARAKALVNVTGPWLNQFMNTVEHRPTTERIRMVKGSHIIVPKLYDHDRAYIFQNADGRIIFAIPYERAFTLIGTTDVDYQGDPSEVAIEESEADYLCRAASEYFTTPITADTVVHAYSGIRPLFDDGASDAKAATRDYMLKTDTGESGSEPPLLSIYGGKITTYRKLAESVLAKLAPHLPNTTRGEWTEHEHLPGGDFAPDEFDTMVEKLCTQHPFINDDHGYRLIRNYGTEATAVLAGTTSENDLGHRFGADLYECEVRFLLKNEWARTAEDILWRRTNLGLVFSEEQKNELREWLNANS
jgi:glycerol-3-phosphate dehydrogenase